MRSLSPPSNGRAFVVSRNEGQGGRGEEKVEKRMNLEEEDFDAMHDLVNELLTSLEVCALAHISIMEFIQVLLYSSRLEVMAFG